jgi:phosphoserine aminotransferase
MPQRVLSFAPGPSMLPDEVLDQVRTHIHHYADTGLGILELGHRSSQYQDLYEATVDLLRELLEVPAGYQLLLLHGGARFQFTMLPANHLPTDGVADYLETGHFAAAAAAEAAHYGKVHLAASTRADRFLRLPHLDETSFSPGARYLHYTSNNTEIGTQFAEPPTHPDGAWLACDASSDLLTRPFDITGHGCVYATSHKNLGTAGVALVIIRDDLIPAVRPVPPFLGYATHVQANSPFNTPPIATIYVLNLMTRWTADHGGLSRMATASAAKAKLLYDTIDHSAFYRGLVTATDRSKVNVTFAAPTVELEADFQVAAARCGMAGLWGYRKVGHLRASLFNAISLDAVHRLAEFMTSFSQTHRHRIPRVPDAGTNLPEQV